MKPVPIPDELIPEGFKRKTFEGPKRDFKNLSVEAMIPITNGLPGSISDTTGLTDKIFVLIELERGDLDRLADNEGRFWLMFASTLLPPFNLGPV